MKDKLIMSIKGYDKILALQTVSRIVTKIYEKTGNKATVSFNGSKGYLSNISISCEGCQNEDNRLFIGTHLPDKIYIFHSDENGIRISTTSRKTQKIREIDHFQIKEQRN